MNQLKIYIGNLTHTYVKISNDDMPFVSALIKSYLKKIFKNKIKCELFIYPNILLQKIKNDPPNILMLSNYCWNEELNLFIMDFAKKINPNILTIFGGPNISLEKEKHEQYMHKNKQLDIHVIGEGEIPSVEIVQSFFDNGLSIKELKKQEIKSCYYIKSDGKFYSGPRNAGLQDLNDIPSPYLNGYLDKFFDGNLGPLIETTRGCPFNCLYCVQGTKYYDKIRFVDLDRTKRELKYIAKQIKLKSPNIGHISIADPNFGMYTKDFEISNIIKELHLKYGWPTYVNITTGKNINTLKTVKNLKGILVLFNSVQSMNPIVLKNINRVNIKQELIQATIEEAEKIGMVINTELILSLPGETFESHKKGLFDLTKLGIRQFTNYQCMLLKGSYLESNEYRKKFDIKTSHRILPRNFGIYEGQKVMEVEEIISSTPTLPFSDYLKSRKLHLIMIIYHSGSRFQTLQKFIEYHNIDYLRWLDALFLNTPNKKVSTLFKDFLIETNNELFESPEACMEFYTKEENFQQLLKGKIGGNLINKYLAIAIFHIWKDIVEYGFNTAEELLSKSNQNKKILNQLNTLKTFVTYQLASGYTKEQILSIKTRTLDYDVQSWIKDGYKNSLKFYQFKKPQQVNFFLPSNKYRIIENVIDTWGLDVIGLSKLITRVQFVDMLKDNKIIKNNQ